MVDQRREPAQSGGASWISGRGSQALELGRAAARVCENTCLAFTRHRHWTNAAALAFFFLLSLLPLLIFLAALVTYLPVPDLFPRVLEFMDRLVPKEAMKLLRGALAETLAGHGRLVSLGILISVWAASTGFNALIGALNTSYLVQEERPFWKRQIVAIVLTLVVGIMAGIALSATVLGGRLGGWLAAILGLDPIFATFWPYIRWVAALLFTMLSVEVIYFLAPNTRQGFKAQSPGAVLAVAIWLAGSYGLQLYLHSFAQANWIYGTLRAVIALMLWLYLTSGAILLGADLNAQLAVTRSKRLSQPTERRRLFVGRY
jgi:membrane protein